MIDLFYHTVTRRPDPWKGTPGELVPTYDILIYHTCISEDKIDAYKAEITRQHVENMEFMPPAWQKALPVPRFWEQVHNINFEI